MTMNTKHASQPGSLAAPSCSPVCDVIMIRCIRHVSVPQQNSSESTGAECGGCIAEKLYQLRDKVERYASSIAFGSPLTNQEVADSLRRITAEANAPLGDS